MVVGLPQNAIETMARLVLETPKAAPAAQAPVSTANPLHAVLAAAGLGLLRHRRRHDRLLHLQRQRSRHHQEGVRRQRRDDRHLGQPPPLVFFGVGGVLYTWVLITYLPLTTSAVTALTLTVIGYVILTGYTSVNAIVKAEVFPASIRALGVSLGYAVANSMFGGTARSSTRPCPRPSRRRGSSSTSGQ
jgi:hypothetical protein